MANPNLEILLTIVSKLGALANDFVFIGGCTTALLITDKATPAIRPTKDVDGIVEAYTYSQYADFENRLEALGFQRAMDGPICRWEFDSILLDVMPIKGEFLGFNSRWFDQAVRTSTQIEISTTTRIRVVSPVYFIATKLEAFHDRGKGDYLASSDLEDVVA